MLNSRIRVDLHIHSNESWHKEETGLVKDSDINHLDVLFRKLEDNRVNFISITDHNYLNAPLYHELEQAIEEQRCSCLEGVVPGVEFDVVLEKGMKGCHVMAYFDVKKPNQYDHIAQVLENHSERTHEFKYDRAEFEKVIYEIGLPTLLLAFQRCDPEAVKSGNADQSFSHGVSDYITYLKVGYISGFDLQKPMVEGMVRSRLAEVQSVKNIASLIASDCHQWSVYPWHSAGKCGSKPHQFSEYNALPTFRGLQMALTSPDTRFNRFASPNCRAIESLTIGGQVVPLSKGINAIIGDNGSGKSTLLHILAGKPTKHQLEIAKNNSISAQSAGESVRLVEQAALANQYMESVDLEQAFGIDYYPNPSPDHFRSDIADYVNAVSERIDSEIKAHAEPLEKTCSIETPEKAYYIAFASEQMKPLNDEEVAKRVRSLGEAMRIIESELSAESYSIDQKNSLRQAARIIASVLSEKQSELDEMRSTNRAMGMVYDRVQEYERLISKKRSSDDEKARRLAQQKTEVVNGVLARAKAACDKAACYPTFPNLNTARQQGHDFRTRAGYRFVTYYPYYSMTDAEIESNLNRTLFNRVVASSEDLRDIDTMEKWVDCVRGTKDSDEVANKLQENLKRFLEAMSKPIHEIHQLSSSSEAIGNTLGERSLVFFKVIADKAFEDDSVLLIDQPEDNVSNLRVSSELASTLNNLRDNHQVIIVTHNPLLVVNLDVDNVVYVEGKRESNERGRMLNKLKVTAGCLEDEESNILDIIAKQMDGGRDAIQRRLNAYGGLSAQC